MAHQLDAGGVCSIEAVKLLWYIPQLKFTQYPVGTLNVHLGVVLHLVHVTKRASELYQFRQLHWLRLLMLIHL